MIRPPPTSHLLTPPTPIPPHRDIHRIELMARESNGRAISLYRSLGFRIEGRLEGRIRGTDGQFEADLPMAWRRGAA